MNRQTIETFRRILVDRGHTLLRRRRRALADEQELLDEREPDWEDVAADRTAARVLARVSDAEGAALARIAASLARIDRGTYGACVVCHRAIEEQRLRAIPETDRCAACAKGH
jgi:RNA polymerase-binding protein DksA